MSTGWEEVAGGRLRLREGRVGGRGHDGAVAGRAWRRGRRELRHVEGQRGKLEVGSQNTPIRCQGV